MADRSATITRAFPRPQPTRDNAAFWEAARRGELRFQRTLFLLPALDFSLQLLAFLDQRPAACEFLFACELRSRRSGSVFRLSRDDFFGAV